MDKCIEVESRERFKLSIGEALGVAVVEKCIPFHDFKLLAEWLECYEYIIPEKRELSTDLATHLSWRTVKTPHDIFKIYLVSDILFTCFSKQSQERILSWMREYSYYHTPRY